MSDVDRRPFVAPTSLSAGFWAAAREERLVAQRCDDCARFRHYPQHLCPGCGSDAWTWTELSGRGVVHTFTISHRAFDPAWAQDVPYAVATVELDEGIRMVSDLPSEDVADVEIGKAVEVFFDHGTERTLPRFRLSRGGQR